MAGGTLASGVHRQRRRGDLTLPPLLGIEADPSIAEQARANVEAAGLSNCITIHCGDFREIAFPKTRGTVVCNPPYGVRIGDRDQLDALYGDLGRTLKDQASGWDAWVLSGNAAVTGALRMKASRRIPVSNGGIDCRWLLYQVR